MLVESCAKQQAVPNSVINLESFLLNGCKIWTNAAQFSTNQIAA
jgi:hypothetical protein